MLNEINSMRQGFCFAGISAETESGPLLDRSGNASNRWRVLAPNSHPACQRFTDVLHEMQLLGPGQYLSAHSDAGFHLSGS